jgi:alpha-amylase/alpha-mannosidase (GH57 family)
MIYWTPLLHMYQPSFQDSKVLKQIDKECYRPLFRMLEEHDNVKISLNINTVLIEMLREFNLSDTIELLKNLEHSNKIEIIGTAKFHPILPLIPQEEAERQIEMNEEILRQVFQQWKRTGFFPPELSISSQVAKFIRSKGYKWVIMSGIACPSEWVYDQIYTSPNGLMLFFRDDILSNKIAFNDITAKEFVEQLGLILKQETKEKNKYSITAMDVETFGHHIKKFERTFLSKSFELINNEKQIEIEFISNLEKYFPIHNEKIIPKESSWSTTYDDMNLNIPFPLWDHPDNRVHSLFWKIMRSLNNLMNLVENLELNDEWEVKRYSETARWFYDRGICSDTTWWANPDRGTWSPNLIYKGVELLMKSALNAQLALVHANKSELGEGYFDSISFYHNLLLMELYSKTKKFKKYIKEGSQ